MDRRRSSRSTSRSSRARTTSTGQASSTAVGLPPDPYSGGSLVVFQSQLTRRVVMLKRDRNMKKLEKLLDKIAPAPKPSHKKRNALIGLGAVTVVALAGGAAKKSDQQG